MPAELWYDQTGDASRYVLYEPWLQRPALNAVIALPGSDTTSPTAAAFAAYTIANKNFEVLGTNMTTALATFNAGGGITLTTAGADNDQAIVTPHLDTTQTGWAVAGQWTTDNSAYMETTIKTGANIASNITWFGLKLTNTPTVATDDDQAFFRYQDAVGGGYWQFITSRAGVDTTYTVPSTLFSAVAAATKYKLGIQIYSDRTVQGFINDVPIAVNAFSALVTAKNFIPYIGVAASGAAAAKAVSAYYLKGSRAL